MVEAVGGDNIHQKLKRLGLRWNTLIQKCGVGSFLLLDYISLPQFKRFSNKQFEAVLNFLQKEYHSVWDEFRVLLDGYLLTNLVKRITGDTDHSSLSFVSPPAALLPDQLEEQGPATTTTTTTTAVPAVGSKRPREDSSFD